MRRPLDPRSAPNARSSAAARASAFRGCRSISAAVEPSGKARRTRAADNAVGTACANSPPRARSVRPTSATIAPTPPAETSGAPSSVVAEAGCEPWALEL